MLYKVIVSLLRILVMPFYRLEVHGLDNLKKSDRYILVANHKSNLDPIFLASSIDKQINFMGKKELFKNPLLKKIFENLGAFPVERDKTDIKALRHSIKLIDEGHILGIFPEGTRTKNIERSNIKDGVSFIALKSKADIIPVEIISNFKPFKKSKLIIKEPLNINKYLNMKNKESIKVIADEIFYNIYENQLKSIEV